MKPIETSQTTQYSGVIENPDTRQTALGDSGWLLDILHVGSISSFQPI